jgi:hypothetical protein
VFRRVFRCGIGGGLKKAASVISIVIDIVIFRSMFDYVFEHHLQKLFILCIHILRK